MPARDRMHEIVKAALIKDGWTITHDPYTMQYGDRDVYADLGAERALAAERNGDRIAVEVKSFLGASPVDDLEKALGQFVFYRSLMIDTEPERKLFLALPEEAYRLILGDTAGETLMNRLQVLLFTVDVKNTEIIRWRR